MNNMNALVEIGLQEVSKRTHIEVKTLQYMVDKEFDKLGRINALGFLKIISREYNLDLSEWQTEFEDYMGTKKINSENSKTDNMFLRDTPSKPISKWIYIVIIILLIGGSAWYFNASEYVESFIESQVKNEEFKRNSPYTTSPIVEEVEEVLASMPEETNLLDVDLDIPAVEEGEIILESFEANSTLTDVLESEKIEQEVEKDEVPALEALEIKEGTILPNVKIWVGAIYLDTKKRASFLTDEPIVLDLTKDQIITTGHGNFSLVVGGEKYSFVQELPKRFHWTNGEMREINLQEFIDLNGGSAW